MNWRKLRGEWSNVSMLVRRRWERLDERDIRVIAGERDRLVGILQQRYAVPRKLIDREVRRFTREYLGQRRTTIAT